MSVPAVSMPSCVGYKSLGELVDAAGDRFGDRLLWESIEDDSERLTFAQFATASRQFANALLARGVRPGSHVAVMLPNCPAYALAWFALGRLGAVMVPVNTQYTSRELDYVLRNSDAQFLLIDEECKAVLAGIDGGCSVAASGIHRLTTRAGAEGGWEEWVTGHSADKPPDLPPITPALSTIQYTSGSTGFPKGCMLGHDYWLLIGYVRARQGPAPKRMIIDKPLSYMGGKWRLLVCLYAGTTACVARKFSLSKLFQRLVDFRIDFLSVTDPVAKLESHPGLKQLRFSWICASGISPHLHRQLEEVFSAPVREMYGMTETGSTLFVPIEASDLSGSGSCGRPALGRSCRIVDADGKDVCQGEIGELWVAGPGLLQGYYKNEEATRASFTGQWFHTGDLFRQDALGFYYIQGRIKDSIRRSGENISALEVESVVATAPGVLEAAAIGVKDAFRGEEVKVCVVLQPGRTMNDVLPEAIMRHSETQLAAFKVPRFIEYYRELPHTSSGKVAKHLLKGDAPAEQGFALFDRSEDAWVRRGEATR